MIDLGFFDKFRKKKGSIYVDQHNSFYTFDNSTLAGNETLFAAVSMLSNAIACAPITLRHNFDKVKPSENSVARLCAFGFNPNMTTFEFIRSMEAERNCSGAAYALKDYDRNGRVRALYLLKSAEVEPVVQSGTHELYYHIINGDINDYIHCSHIIEVDYISADGYTKGIKPLDVLRNTFNYDRKVKEFSVNQMNYGLKPNIVIKLEGNNISNAIMEKYDAMISRYKQHGILYLDSTKEIRDMQASNVIDPKVFEAEQITIKKVASVFNIPVSKLWGDTKSGSSEEADLMYLKDTLLPIIRMYEQAFTRGLLSNWEREDGYEIKFNMNGFARGNMSVRGEFYQKMIRNGVYSPNFVLELEDLPPYDGGDIHYISKDLVDVKLLPEITAKEISGGGEKNSNGKELL